MTNLVMQRILKLSLHRGEMPGCILLFPPCLVHSVPRHIGLLVAKDFHFRRSFAVFLAVFHTGCLFTLCWLVCEISSYLACKCWVMLNWERWPQNEQIHMWFVSDCISLYIHMNKNVYILYICWTVKKNSLWNWRYTFKIK